ncbi:MAG: molybdopterin-dependent oxidoreductase [Desulfobacteraceae bacterium]|nr:molybdopterin-dependent oxidoreductase [Desulfobacteraceae bacterium]MBC2754624.1 molybdopterin-dependent oxidoreductase [Desulfobacteraceae bacterium]
MESIFLIINGQKITCPSGTTIFEAAEQNGIKIPTLCYHPDLKPYGACRVCLVEDEKTGRLMASCVTPAAADMSILTDTPRILNHRRNIVRLMMAEHPESCIVCSKGNRCELRKIAADLGVGDSGLYPMPNYTPFEQLNPFITRDLSKCILCGKCIRADHELVVTGAIDYNHRGFQSRPATLYEKPLEDSICTFCGTCVSICPTGALSVKNTRYVGTPERETNSICGFCGAGCSLTMGVADQKIVEVNPSKRKISVNGATLCMRGHFANDFINSADRLTRPMLRSQTRSHDENSDDTHIPASWEDAFEIITTRLSEIKREHGPDSIAFVGSSKCSNEENFLFQKIARDIFETRNVVNGGYASGQKLLSYIDEITHGSCRVTTLSDLEDAEVIFVINSDLEQTVPVAGYHVKRAAKKGARVIVIDAFKTDLAALSSLWIRPDLSVNKQINTSDLVNALARRVVAIDSQDKDFINQYTEGFDPYIASFSNFDFQKIAEQSKLSVEIFDQAVELIKGRKVAFVIGADTLNYPDGNQLIDAVMNFSFLTGSIGAKGSGIYVPAAENNLIGAMDMGAVPDLLPGRVKIASEKDKGLDLDAFIESAESGQVKAAYIMGENLLRSLPQPDRVEAALQKLEFLVVQDIVRNRTTKIADVILPGAAVYEKYGSFTNMEGRIQTFGPVVSPPGDARADWDILAQVAKVMGHPEQYQKIEKIRQEIRRVVPMYQGLGNHQQDWIKNSETGNPFSANNTKFSFLPALPAGSETFDASYPFMAKISSPGFHLGSGTRTSRSERIQAYDRKGEIELSSADCRDLGLNGSGQVRVKSKFGTLEREFKENNRLPGGHILIPMAVNNNDAMQLVGLTSKEQSDSCGWTVSRVSIEKI